MSAMPKTSATPPATATPQAESHAGGVADPSGTPETYHKCWGCGRTKPRSEFYSSEKKKSKCCKKCHCARVYKQNKNNGRRSMSLSPAEYQWLDTVLRALPCSSLRDYVRQAAYVKLAQKMAALMKDRE